MLHVMLCAAACTYNAPLGMTTREIRAGQISASSNYPPEWDRGCSEKFARVYQPSDQAWCAKYKSASEWLQVDLGVPAKVAIHCNLSLRDLRDPSSPVATGSLVDGSCPHICSPPIANTNKHNYQEVFYTLRMEVNSPTLSNVTFCDFCCF